MAEGVTLPAEFAALLRAAAAALSPPKTGEGGERDGAGESGGASKSAEAGESGETKSGRGPEAVGQLVGRLIAMADSPEKLLTLVEVLVMGWGATHAGGAIELTSRRLSDIESPGWYDPSYREDDNVDEKHPDFIAFKATLAAAAARLAAAAPADWADAPLRPLRSFAAYDGRFAAFAAALPPPSLKSLTRRLLLAAGFAANPAGSHELAADRRRVRGRAWEYYNLAVSPTTVKTAALLHCAVNSPEFGCELAAVDEGAALVEICAAQFASSGDRMRATRALGDLCSDEGCPGGGWTPLGPAGIHALVRSRVADNPALLLLAARGLCDPRSAFAPGQRESLAHKVLASSVASQACTHFGVGGHGLWNTNNGYAAFGKPPPGLVEEVCQKAVAALCAGGAGAPAVARAVVEGCRIVWRAGSGYGAPCPHEWGDGN